MRVGPEGQGVTDVCVACPTLLALAEGYDAFVVTDASGTFNAAVRQAAWMRMAQAGAHAIDQLVRRGL